MEGRRRKATKWMAGWWRQWCLNMDFERYLLCPCQEESSRPLWVPTVESPSSATPSAVKVSTWRENLYLWPPSDVHLIYCRNFSPPIITQPLQNVLKSPCEHIWERTEMKCMSLWFIFHWTRRNDREPIFQDEREKKSDFQEKSFQVHLLHISDVFISTSRATIKLRTWERVPMHFCFGFHK